MKRIGVFSGTFDPIHIAHVEACLVAAAALDLDIVALLLEKLPIRKQNVTEYYHRLEMMKLATSKYKRIKVLDFAKNNVTVNTAIEALDVQFGQGEYWYILGSDLLTHIESWYDFDRFITNFNLCVVLRNNSEKKEAVCSLKRLGEKYPNFKAKILPEVWSEVSSSKIRKEIEETGASKLVYPGVLAYIQGNKIYEKTRQ